MAISEEQVLTLAETGLTVIASSVGGPIGLGLGIVAQLIGPVVAAVQGGGQPDAVLEAVKKALVAASDAEMRAELPPGS